MIRSDNVLLNKMWGIFYFEIVNDVFFSKFMLLFEKIRKDTSYELFLAKTHHIIVLTNI